MKTQVRAKICASGRKSKRGVVGVDLRRAEDRLGGEGDVVVGQDCALRNTGSARGVDDGGDIAGLDIGDPGVQGIVGYVAAEIQEVVESDDPVVAGRG